MQVSERRREGEYQREKTGILNLSAKNSWESARVEEMVVDDTMNITIEHLGIALSKSILFVRQDQIEQGRGRGEKGGERREERGEGRGEKGEGRGETGEKDTSFNCGVCACHVIGLDGITQIFDEILHLREVGYVNVTFVCQDL